MITEKSEAATLRLGSADVLLLLDNNWAVDAVKFNFKQVLFLTSCDEGL